MTPSSTIITKNHKLLVTCQVNDLLTAIQIRVVSAESIPLTRQQVLDAVSDYLLIDPKGYFEHERAK
jgi:hypothetical protein